MMMPQGTAMSANVVYINIDWKKGRHNKTLKANMNPLRKTIAGVVREMKPTMICMCEVGEATIPLTEEQMRHVALQSMHAWKEAATEHFELRSMFEVGAPYMMIYQNGPIHCSCHRILCSCDVTSWLSSSDSEGMSPDPDRRTVSTFRFFCRKPRYILFLYGELSRILADDLRFGWLPS